MNNRKQSIKNLTFAALFAALIAVFTAYLFHIPIKIGANTAYLHFGDAFIFIAASLLPTPYAVSAAALGGTLGDLLCGAAIWAPYTFVAKSLVALSFTAKSDKIICKRNIFAIGVALVVTIVVYYVAEALIYGNWIAPMLSVFGNVVQVVGSGIIYAVVAVPLQKSKIKKFF